MSQLEGDVLMACSNGGDLVYSFLLSICISSLQISRKIMLTMEMANTKNTHLTYSPLIHTQGIKQLPVITYIFSSATEKEERSDVKFSVISIFN